MEIIPLTLQEKKVKNYLRKQVSYNNDNNIRSKLMCLFYSNINNIPILKELSEEEYNNYITHEFPYYFKDVDKNKIIEIFNVFVSPRKPISIVPFNKNKNNYDISIDEDNNNCLKISLDTFRPYYYHDWKQKTEEINKTSYENQTSFYNEYLKFYVKNKKFPDFNEFIVFIFNKDEQPLHKDIKNAFINVEKSYENVKEFIQKNNLTFNEIRKCILLSTNLSNRKLMQLLEK